jgi:hypothetical protein
MYFRWYGGAECQINLKGTYYGYENEESIGSTEILSNPNVKNYNCSISTV